MEMYKLIRLSVVVAVLLLPRMALAGAGDQSTQQMALVNSPQFTTRITYLLTQQARVVLTEAGIGATHGCRALYAQKVSVYAAAVTPVASTMIVGGVNLVGTVTGSGATADSTATDAAILSQIATFWNQLAGCDTGSGRRVFERSSRGTISRRRVHGSA